jgi:hypothetical protein
MNKYSLLLATFFLGYSTLIKAQTSPKNSANDSKTTQTGNVKSVKNSYALDTTIRSTATTRTKKSANALDTTIRSTATTRTKKSAAVIK